MNHLNNSLSLSPKCTLELLYFTKQLLENLGVAPVKCLPTCLQLQKSIGKCLFKDMVLISLLIGLLFIHSLIPVLPWPESLSLLLAPLAVIMPPALIASKNSQQQARQQLERAISRIRFLKLTYKQKKNFSAVRYTSISFPFCNSLRQILLV